ncbi:MAG: MBOAT family protein [Kiritimatiellae bacterium]|nr:MBOAT family protein [Kiritimatiellia bacterium]
MLFNSFSFLVFLPLVFAGYWLLQRNLRWQNLFVVAASYVFYGWWDWQCLVLIAFTSAWSYAFGLMQLRDKRPQGGSLAAKLRLAASIVINLGILGYFKYANFFVAEGVRLLQSLGFEAHAETLNVILPVGISFYTFQALSYTIDVYRRTIVPTRDPVAFFAFISFFPQLVAGPIERAVNLLPQFLAPRTFSYPLAVEGCRQMLWGFFKKVLVADTCAYAVNKMLAAEVPSSISLWVAMVLFAFQIYGDFSGYSDIAIGCAKLFGIRLMRNFAYPYFARDIAEFWRRWHISLTTWFRDYLYIPLGGSRCSAAGKIRNTFAIFLVSGIWHGANWTFLAWGAFHAALFMPLLLAGRNRRYAVQSCATLRDLPKILLTFALVVVGWTFFRAPDISTALHWLARMFSFSDLHLSGTFITTAYSTLWPLAALVAIEWIGRCGEFPPVPRNRFLRIMLYYAVAALVLFYSPIPQTFIYFQF